MEKGLFRDDQLPLQHLIGLVWGHVYLKTENLWTAWIAHTLIDSASKVLDVTTVEGVDTGVVTRMSAYCIVALLGISLVKGLARRFELPDVKPGEDERGG